MALTIASLVCTVFVEMGGWNSSSTTLNNMYFLQVNMSGLDVNGASSAAKTTDLDTILASVKDSLNSTYQVHLWNYCTSSTSNPGEINWCSPRESGFVFDPVKVWSLNSDATATTANAAASSVAASNPSLASEAAAAASSAAAQAKDTAEDYENKVLGEGTKKALDVYRSVAKWQFIAYEVSFWTTLATIVIGILAIFSRWGSLFTWILSIVSSRLNLLPSAAVLTFLKVSTLFTFAASLTSSILFGTLTGALKGAFDPYNIKVKIGSHALGVAWLATAFSVGATLFWLFSVCCCSGRSNPHHKDNKGGLWHAEPKGQGYQGGYGRGSVRVEKTGGGYERVASPMGDRVPLTDYPQQQSGYGRHMHPGGAYEPFRQHGRY